MVAGMNRYALISGGRVVNVVMADPIALNEIQGYDAVVETEIAGPGWSWTQEGGFTPPEPTPASPSPQPSAILTRLEFLRRFTPTERQAIRSARAQSVELDDFMFLLEMAETIHLDNADVIAGLALLEASGLLAAGRASEILSG